jgi:hypothetical protein
LQCDGKSNRKFQAQADGTLIFTLTSNYNEFFHYINWHFIPDRKILSWGNGKCKVERKLATDAARAWMPLKYASRENVLRTLLIRR